jgi:hypothetical protein
MLVHDTFPVKIAIAAWNQCEINSLEASLLIEWE